MPCENTTKQPKNSISWVILISYTFLLTKLAGAITYFKEVVTKLTFQSP